VKFQAWFDRYIYNISWIGIEKPDQAFWLHLVFIKSLLFLILVQAIAIMQWPSNTQLSPKARYILTTSNGVPLVPVPLKLPVAEGKALAFGSKVITRSMTFDKSNYRNRIFNTSHRYYKMDWDSVDGSVGGQFNSVSLAGVNRLESKRVYPGQELMLLIYKSGLLKSAIAENSAYRAEVGEGRIIQEGSFDVGGYEQYQYLIEYPATILRYENHMPPAKKLKVSFVIKVVRVGPSTSNDLLMIERIQMTVGNKHV
jgi:hypothetical protein